MLVYGASVAADMAFSAQTGLAGYELEDDVTVPAGVTLTVEPGVGVMGQAYTELKVQGRLAAVGTAARPITFTSAADTGWGEWSGLVFDGGTGDLRHVTVRYGGDGNSVTSQNVNIAVKGVLTGQVRIESSRVVTGYDYGLYVDNSHVVVSDTLFAGNDHDPIRYYALYAGGIDTTIGITNSRFENNGHYPLSVQAGDLPGVLQGNTFSGNGQNYLEIRAGAKDTILSDVTLPNDNGLDGYQLTDNVWVGEGVTLTLQPSVTLRLESYSGGLGVHGYLQALGTAAQPISYLAYNQGGGIDIAGPQARALLRHVVISDTYASDGGVIARDGATVRLGDVEIVDSSTRGLYVNDATVTIEDSRFARNNNEGIEAVYGARLVLTNTTVISNHDSGLYIHYGAHLQGQGLEIIDNNTFGWGGHLAGGLKAEDAGTVVTLTQSVVQDNTGSGLLVYGYDDSARVTLRHSRIQGNSEQQVYARNYYDYPDVRYNWWGTTTPTATLFNGNVITAPWIITDTFAPGYFDLANDIYEPNDTFAQAEPAAVVNATLAAFLDPWGDADLYRLSVEEAGVLLAIADAADTPLALQVDLYDVNETLLDTATGPVGGVVTATASISPGVYFVRVVAAGDVPGSRSPYRLTPLLADGRGNLVAQTVSQGGRTYDMDNFAVSLSSGDSTEVQAGAPPSLTAEGGYYLRGRLTNGRNQVLAESLSTFFLSDSPLALTLRTDQPAYRPGQAVGVSGQVHNTGSDPIGPETLILSRDGVPFYTEAVSLPPGGVHDFDAATAAPSAAGHLTLTAQISTTQVVAIVDVVEPELDITLDAPDVVLPGEFSAELTLANNGQVPVALDVDFGQLYTPTLQPGELVVYSRTLALTQTTELAVQISGDVTETVTHTVGLSAAPNLSLTPDDPQHEGDVEIPYTLVNSGTVDLVAQVAFGLGETDRFRVQPSGVGGAVQPSILRADLPALQQQGIAWLPPQQLSTLRSSSLIVSRTHTLPAGHAITDTLVVSLTRGLRPVQATLRVNEAHNPGLFGHSLADAWEQTTSLTLTVRADNDLRLAAFGAPTVTVVITNVGWNAFSGTLRIVGQREAVFASQEQGIHLPTEATRAYTATVDTSDLSPGPYTITLQVWAENGILVDSTAITGAVPAPDFVVTQVPTPTTLFSDRVVTLTFGVENQGQAPDLASFHLAVGNLLDEVQKQWVPAGTTALFSFTTYLPLDLPTIDAYATYVVTSTEDAEGDGGAMVFHVEGISLTVAASTDQPTYVEGDPVVVTLEIANNDAVRSTGDLTALVNFNMLTHTQVFSLAPGAHVTFTFPYTATFQGDRKIFYGLYGQQNDRGAYLNTLYLYRRNLGATLEPDQEVYQPGETLHAALVTTLTQGVLNVYVLGEAYTLTIGSDTGFTYDVPADLARGSYALYYTVHGCDCLADGREQATWFDVAAPWIRVIESHLGEGPYETGDAVSGTLTIASDTAVDAVVQSWLHYPNGAYGAFSLLPVHLEARLDNQVVVTAVITDTQMGLHRLMYRLIPPTSELRRAAQTTDEAEEPETETVESFDVGPAELNWATTDRGSYPHATDPVQVLLDLYSQAGGAAPVVITLDDGSIITQEVNLNAGYQTVTVTLTGPISPGPRLLTATLTMDGYWAARQTAFDYGDSLPDLRVGALGVAGSGTATRTLSALVSNEGESAAGATTARFYDGDPDQGGALIGAATVPALEAGGQTVVAVAWPIQGAGGAHTLYVTVEPVVEFDEENNTDQADITLPRLDSSLAASPGSIQAGEVVSLTTRLENLQGAAPLPLEVTVEVRSPLGGVVYSRTWTLTLDGGEERWLNDAWPSGPDAEPGIYAVMQKAEDAYGERDLHGDSFAIQVPSEIERWRIYLPLVLREE